MKYVNTKLSNYWKHISKMELEVYGLELTKYKMNWNAIDALT